MEASLAHVAARRRRMITIGVSIALVLVFAVYEINFWRGNVSLDTTPLPAKPEQDPDFHGVVEEVTMEYEKGDLHFYTFGDTKAKRQVFAIHGPKPDQDGLHWLPNLSLLQSMGTFYLMDLPGFGKSTVNAWVDDVPNFNQAVTVGWLMEQLKLMPSKKEIIFVARSWGAEVVMQMFRQFESLRHMDVKVIFIAPTPKFDLIQDTLKNHLASMPGIIMISKNDQSIPDGFRRKLQTTFPRCMYVEFDDMSSHQPEIDTPLTFAKTVKEWWEIRNN